VRKIRLFPSFDKPYIAANVTLLNEQSIKSEDFSLDILSLSIVVNPILIFYNHSSAGKLKNNHGIRKIKLLRIRLTESGFNIYFFFIMLIISFFQISNRPKFNTFM